MRIRSAVLVLAPLIAVGLFAVDVRSRDVSVAPAAQKPVANGPRGLFAGDPNQPSAAEKVAAYDSFVAGSGTYVLSESTLTLNAILHKNPNEMKGETLAYNFESDGSKLVLTIVNPPFAPGRERRTVLTRIE